MIVRKILKLLPERFRPKVTTIEESKDIDTLIVEELVGSLHTFEITLKPNIKKKGVTLKAEELSSLEKNSNDKMTFITRGFRKFYKKKEKNLKR